MKIESLNVNFGTLELLVRFENSSDLRATADKIMNSNTVSKEENEALWSLAEKMAELKK